MKRIRQRGRGQPQFYLRCVITTLVIIWLTIVAPLTCSYHGFLLRPMATMVLRAPAEMTETTAAMVGLPVMSGRHEHPFLSQRQVAFALTSHHTADSDTAMFSVLIIAAPAGIQVSPPAVSHARWIAPANTPLLLWPPPEQPPKPA